MVGSFVERMITIMEMGRVLHTTGALVHRNIGEVLCYYGKYYLCCLVCYRTGRVTESAILMCYSTSRVAGGAIPMCYSTGHVARRDIPMCYSTSHVAGGAIPMYYSTGRAPPWCYGSVL